MQIADLNNRWQAQLGTLFIAAVAVLALNVVSLTPVMQDGAAWAQEEDEDAPMSGRKTQALSKRVYEIITTANELVDAEDYADNRPALDPEAFFDGQLTAHGVVKNRSGKVIRHFNADIKAYFDEHPDEFRRPAQVRLAQLVVPDEAQAKALLSEVVGYIEADRLKAREIFSEFVRRHSKDDRARLSGGDLGFVGEPGVSKTPNQDKAPPAVARAGFAIGAVGELAPAPIKSSAGWHIVQKTGFRRPYQRTLADARTTIRNNLFRARKAAAMEAFVADLRGKAKIEVDEANLDKVELKRGRPPTGMPPGLKLDIPRPPGALKPPNRPALPGQARPPKLAPSGGSK